MNVAMNCKEYLNAVELADFLNVSVRTIEKNSFKIVGRVKIGRLVRYHLPAIQNALFSKKNIFKSK